MAKSSRLITGISLTLLILISIFVPAMPVLGDSTEETTIGDVTDPGVLPDSGFYFMKNWGRSLQLMFASSDAERAELQLRYANEDVLAIKKLCDAGKCEIAARHAEQYELQLQNAIQHMEQARLHQGDKTAEGLTPSWNIITFDSRKYWQVYLSKLLNQLKTAYSMRLKTPTAT